jgi:hypothetical protein
VDSEDIRVVYKEEWENVRYQDKLRWSRFQLISVVEGVILFSGYNNVLPQYEISLITLVGSLLVFIISLISIKDARDSKSHLDIISILEIEMKVPPFKRKPLLRHIYGNHLMHIGIIIINFMNIVIIDNRGILTF